jgi:LacI family transcriptional regulator
MALGLLAGLHERGIRVPHEIAVIGFDDRHAASMVWPALTTLAHPNRELGEAAARRLLDRIAGRRPPNREPVPPLPMRLVIRESS